MRQTKITITKKKNSKYIPMDEPYAKIKGTKESLMAEMVREMAKRISQQLYSETTKPNPLLKKLNK